SAETCEHGIQLSLLQHSTLISEKIHPGIVDPLKGICDTVDTPPASPYADEINSCYFYAIALANDTLTNPFSFHYVESYNFRILTEGRWSWEAWWMENEDPMGDGRDGGWSPRPLQNGTLLAIARSTN
ncbi:unnamed protein product, partial [Durusdinium trenchii]